MAFRYLYHISYNSTFLNRASSKFSPVCLNSKFKQIDVNRRKRIKLIYDSVNKLFFDQSVYVSADKSSTGAQQYNESTPLTLINTICSCITPTQNSERVTPVFISNGCFGYGDSLVKSSKNTMKIFDINNTAIRQQNLINLNVKLGRSGVRYLSTKNNNFGIEKIKWLKTLRKWSQNDCYGTDHHRPHYLTEKGFHNILSVIKNPWTVSVLTANAIAFNIYQKFKTDKENIVFENDVRKKLAENPTSALKKRTGINLQPKTLITPTDYELLQKGKINDSNSKFNRKIVILQKRKAKKERLSNRKNVMNDFIDNSEKNVITCQHTKPSFTLNKFLMQHTFRAITPGSSIFFASNNCSSFTNNKSPEKDISDTDTIVKKSIHKKRTSKRIRRVQRKNVQLKSSKRKLLRPLCESNGNTQLNFETKRQDVNNIKKREIKSWKYFDSPSKLEGNKAEIFKFDELSQQCTTSEPLQPPPPTPSKPSEPKTTPPTKPPSKEHDDPWAPPIRKSSSNTNLTHMQKLQCLYDRFCTTFKSSFLQSCNTLKTSFQNLVSAPKHHVQNDKLNNKRFSSKTKVEKVSVIRPHKLKKTNPNNISWKGIERSNISSATDVIKQSAKYMTTATKIHNQTLWLNLCAFLKANPKPNEIENLLTHTPLHNGDGNQGISRYSISKLIPRKTTFNNKKGCFSSSRRRWNHQTPNSGIINKDHAKPKCLIMKEDLVHDVSKSNQQFLKHNFGQKLPNIQIDNDKVFAIKSYKLNNPKLSSTININKSNLPLSLFSLQTIDPDDLKFNIVDGIKEEIKTVEADGCELNNNSYYKILKIIVGHPEEEVCTWFGETFTDPFFPNRYSKYGGEIEFDV